MIMKDTSSNKQPRIILRATIHRKLHSKSDHFDLQAIEKHMPRGLSSLVTETPRNHVKILEYKALSVTKKTM